ncbi:hypothetical protein H2201_008478 [Coniosporium apollinis]|uniref:Shugoshin C-terminal domain-containing protein n=1 Tax=Coniosporium apollinis TaxID=61459 RepID=A0ABQ9NGW0_9PEZI|nr:hypothetical protein H2201_008478 [Coniosporium apollinis]
MEVIGPSTRRSEPIKQQQPTKAPSQLQTIRPSIAQPPSSIVATESTRTLQDSIAEREQSTEPPSTRDAAPRFAEHSIPMQGLSIEQLNKNFQYNASVQQTHLSAAARLPTQISQNAAVPAGQQKRIDAVEEAVTQLRDEVHHLTNLVEAMREQLWARPMAQTQAPPPVPAQPFSRAPPVMHHLPHVPLHLAHDGCHVSIPSQADVRVPSSYRLREPPCRLTEPLQASYQTRQPQMASAETGWTPVNPVIERNLPRGLDGGNEPADSSVGSPKCPKRATLDQQIECERTRSYDTATGSSTVLSNMDTDGSDSNHNPHPIPSASISHKLAASTNERNPDGSCHLRPQRSTRDGLVGKRGRRGGGCGGRLRKSVPAWKKSNRASSQTANSYCQSPSPRKGSVRSEDLARLKSGGARHVGITRSPPSADPYVHIKKTRTKPTRNAEGILIRKDGHPDMRSRTSAANLRKMHACKEKERAVGRLNTPTSALANAPVLSCTEGADTPSPASSAGESREPSTQERHDMIMKLVFPHGLEDPSGKYDAATFFQGSSSLTMDAEVKSERVSCSNEVENATRNGTKTIHEHQDGVGSPTEVGSDDLYAEYLNNRRTIGGCGTAPGDEQRQEIVSPSTTVAALEHSRVPIEDRTQNSNTASRKSPTRTASPGKALVSLLLTVENV